MGTDELEHIAQVAEDLGLEPYVYRHEYDEEVIVSVEVNGDVFENENTDVELEDFSYAEGMWRE